MYIVIELQKMSDTQVIAPPVITRENWNEAESEYCRVRSIAAVSEVPRHTVIFTRDDGLLYEYKSYSHEPEAPEDAPEQS